MINETTHKKKQDFSKVEFFNNDEGLCVKCMHIDSHDTELKTVKLMHDDMAKEGYALDITDFVTIM